MLEVELCNSAIMNPRILFHVVILFDLVIVIKFPFIQHSCKNKLYCSVHYSKLIDCSDDTLNTQQ